MRKSRFSEEQIMAILKCCQINAQRRFFDATFFIEYSNDHFHSVPYFRKSA